MKKENERMILSVLPEERKREREREREREKKN